MNDMNVLPENTSKTFGAEERRFVYCVARRIVHSDEDADDVAQDALLIAHRNLGNFRGDSHLRTWLYRIATTTALAHLRRARRAKAHVPLADFPLVDPGSSAEASLAEAQLGALVREAIATLSPLYRNVLLARAEWSEAEVAQSLGITLANVKIRAHRARKQVRDAIAQNLEPAGLGVAS
jgi:RNA polymerase sigma-70 factor (ECF subfamily)